MICQVESTRNPFLPNRLRMKLARIEQELTQAELAEKVGVTRQTIGLIENGQYNPSLKLCIGIAKVLAYFGENYHLFRSYVTTPSERSDAGRLSIGKW